MAVPLTPSGIGVHEAVLAGLFVAIGLPPGAALAALLLARGALVITTLLGAATFVRGRHDTGASLSATWSTAGSSSDAL